MNVLEKISYKILIIFYNSMNYINLIIFIVIKILVIQNIHKILNNIYLKN